MGAESRSGRAGFGITWLPALAIIAEAGRAFDPDPGQTPARDAAVIFPKKGRAFSA